MSQQELKNNVSAGADFRVDEKLFSIKSLQTLSSICGPLGCGLHVFQSTIAGADDVRAIALLGRDRPG